MLLPARLVLAGACPPLLELLAAEFRRRNPRIGRADAFEMRAWQESHVVLARGLRADATFAGDFDDELLGVFLLDQSLCRVTRVLDVFPTPRWNDYSLRLARLTDERLVVRCQGRTYGDRPQTKSYELARPDRP